MEHLLRNLVPNVDHYIQVRATAGEEISEWSPLFKFRTGGDDEAPSAPSNLKVEIKTRDFILTYDKPTTNENGTPLRDFSHYEVTVSSPDTDVTHTFEVFDTTFNFDFWTNYNALGGAWQGNITFSVRSVDRAGNKSKIPAEIVALKPRPNPVRNLEFKAIGQSFVATWDAPEDSEVMDYTISATAGGITREYLSNERRWELTFQENNGAFNGYKTTVEITVKARDSANQLSDGVTVTASKAKPKPPANPTWVMEGSNFVGKWDAVTENEDHSPLLDLKGYLITLKGGTREAIFFTTDTTFTLTSEQNIAAFRQLQANITFKVQARNNTEQNSEPTADITTGNPAPAAPTNVVATAGQDQISVSWTPPPDTDLDHYRVYSATSKTGTPIYQGRVAAGTSQMSFASVAYSQTFFVAIQAYDTFDSPSPLAWSNNSVSPTSPFTVDTSAPPATTISGATPTRAVSLSAAVNLTWTKVTAADLAGYHIRYSENVTPRNWNYIDIIDPAVTMPYLVDNLTSQTAYVFQVRSYDTMINTSAWSPESAPVTSSRSDISPTEIATSVTIINGGTLRSGNYVESTTDTPGQGWLLSPSLLNIERGRINANVISAGELRSRLNITSGPDAGQPLWSLNLGGNATVRDIRVRGKMVVGGTDLAAASNAAISIASANYGGTGNQWAIMGDGSFVIKTGTGARTELTSSGLYGHDGSKQTFNLSNSGSLYVDGNINAGSGNFYGSVTVNGRLEVYGSEAYVIARRNGNAEWVMLDGRSGNNNAISSSSGNFTVDYYGNLTAYNATVSGTVTAGSGKIAGFNIDSSLGIYSGTGTNAVYMRPGAGFWAGADAQSNASWYVTQGGYMRAISGYIGGWNINSNGTLTSQNGTITLNGANGSISGLSISASQIGAGTLNAMEITGSTFRTGGANESYVRLTSGAKDALQWVDAYGNIDVDIRGYYPNPWNSSDRGLYINGSVMLGNVHGVIHQQGKRAAGSLAYRDDRVRAGHVEATIYNGGVAAIYWPRMSQGPSFVVATVSSNTTNKHFTHRVQNFRDDGFDIHCQYSAPAGDGDHGKEPGFGTKVFVSYYAEIVV